MLAIAALEIAFVVMVVVTEQKNFRRNGQQLIGKKELIRSHAPGAGTKERDRTSFARNAGHT